MFDEIRDFVVKNKIWFIICGIICALAGALMAGLISLYFLIAVAVGLIVSIVSGFMKNKEIQDLEKYKIQDLEKYKKEARKKITREYIQKLDYEKVKDEGDKYKETCSVLLPYNGIYRRGFCSSAVRRILRAHFFSIKLSDCSLTKIIGDMEVFFEVLAGVNYNEAVPGEHYKFLFYIPMEGNNYSPGISKCFFEYTILCACYLYQKKEWPKPSAQLDNMFDFRWWESNHEHDSVLKQPETDTESGQNLSK